MLSTRISRGIRRCAYSTKSSIPIVFHPSKLPRTVTADEAVRVIGSNSNVYVHTAAACPTVLLDALARRLDDAPANSVTNVRLHHLHIEGPTPFLRHPQNIRSNSLFIGANLRDAVNRGDADATSIFLSEIPLLFRRKKLPLDIALVTISPFDQHGFASLGVSVDVALAAVESAKQVIAVVNPSMPRTHGRGLIHASNINLIVHSDTPIYEKHEAPATAGTASDREAEISARIGEHISAIIPDGACLQMGIGGIPDAVLASLVRTGQQKLGIHTELLGPGVLDLIASGQVTNDQKDFMPGKISAAFCVGTRELYDFIDDNPMFHFDESSVINDPAVIKRNDRTVSINSCIEVDLTGQIVSDSIGTRMFSGFGGQLDFARGAALSKDGLPIIALPSATAKGESRIVPFVKEGAGVVTTRAHAHFICTEYGIVDLFGRSLRERALLLTSIAHPNHRQSLEAATIKRFGRLQWQGFMPHADVPAKASGSSPETKL
ncbi:mitochondrial acetyl-CoA hydrolase/transferase family protein (4-hydroxybutyrate-CoA transferase) [Andalucia godoyi]|uniref:Mitochondrial acetyl-CoA hydrolase/transferase family protein (4-hydroxybutyrate-CoA transferase) n=1 Tax=Andalucia godoyi TaxID=505711 RepID=A0A8K0F4B9_ANDGO|nr:mitochondrial acetyl-CoA hydrolase/transferase family protein (4-hydroxybutyrate-CoA transferase) [Andalucia godoyi]|eukprot:ANDGO_04396.mRNA.1 mitochondrial acetyl-CoA hydrolase/transferase family protein (4-hydroxybutyrate-CoA transferase)